MENISVETCDQQLNPDSNLIEAEKFFQNLPTMDLSQLSLEEYDKNFHVLISNFPSIGQAKVDFDQEFKIIQKIEEKVGVGWTDKNSEDLEIIRGLLENEEKELEKMELEKMERFREKQKILDEKMKEIAKCELEMQQLTGEIRRIEECRRDGLGNVSGYAEFLLRLGVDLKKSEGGFVVMCKDDEFEIELTEGSRYRMKNKGKTFMYGKSEYVYPTELSSHFAKLLSHDN